MFLITDLNWFSKLINILSSSILKSEDFAQLKDIVGKNVPIWTMNVLKERLDDLIPLEKVKLIKMKLIFFYYYLKIFFSKFDPLLQYLSDLSLIKCFDDLIIPMFLLNENEPSKKMVIMISLNYTSQIDVINLICFNSFRKVCGRYGTGSSIAHF